MTYNYNFCEHIADWYRLKRKYLLAGIYFRASAPLLRQNKFTEL